MGWAVVVKDVCANKVRCGVDLCGSIPAVAGVTTSISSMINPPSTNSRIVCCR